MTTDYRAELQRLVKAYDDHALSMIEHDVEAFHLAVSRARTYLSQPEPEGVEDRIAKLEADLERERLRLAACGVVAMADTPESAAKARDMSPEYHSASLADVIHQIDALMELRAALKSQAPTDKELGPEPEEPTDDELLRCYGLAKRDHCYEGPMDDWLKRAERAATVCGLRAVIAADRTRWGRPAVEPVPKGPTPEYVAAGCLEEAARQEPGSPMQQLLSEAGGLLLTRCGRPTTTQGVKK